MALDAVRADYEDPDSHKSGLRDHANTISGSRRIGVASDAETRHALSLFSSTRMALSRSAPCRQGKSRSENNFREAGCAIFAVNGALAREFQRSER
jgi:hypothetical protein